MNLGSTAVPIKEYRPSSFQSFFSRPLSLSVVSLLSLLLSPSSPIGPEGRLVLSVSFLSRRYLFIRLCSDLDQDGRLTVGLGQQGVGRQSRRRGPRPDVYSLLHSPDKGLKKGRGRDGHWSDDGF